MIIENIKDLKYHREEIIEKRTNIRNKFISKSKNVKNGDIQCISNEDLRILFRLYDEDFFKDHFSRNFKGHLKFSLSTRMTSAAGKTIYSKKIKSLLEEDENYEIRMGIKFFFEYSKVDRDKMVSGINTKDSLEAFQIVFEHELGHLLELHLYKESSCKKLRFKTMVNNIFAHTEVHHQLPSQKEIISEKYGLAIGQKVSFISEGEKYSGFIYKINKRATVMVKDKKGRYKDSDGNTYSKWYVQFGQLV
jgi:predicted SprT family Zn-dependent metalloprotease